MAANINRVVLDRRTCPITSAARSRTAARCASRATPTSAAADAAAVAADAAARRQLYSPGGAEPGYIAPDPKNLDIFYAGGNNGSFLTRLDRRTGNTREVESLSARVLRRAVERAGRALAVDLPDHLLARRSHRALHLVAARVADDERRQTLGQDQRRPHASRSEDDGRSGGPITHDMNSPEVYGTVFALGPGKKDVNILWAGSDDGLVHVTRDGGKTWTNVTPKEMPDLGRVSSDRRVVVRSRRGLRRGQEAAARRPRALHLPHARLRQDLDEDRQRHPGERLRARRCARIRRAAACSTPARSTASTSRTTTATTGSRCR